MWFFTYRDWRGAASPRYRNSAESTVLTGGSRLSDKGGGGGGGDGGGGGGMEEEGGGHLWVKVGPGSATGSYVWTDALSDIISAPV